MSAAPNIVLIMADQLTPFATGAYGHPLVKSYQPGQPQEGGEGVTVARLVSS